MDIWWQRAGRASDPSDWPGREQAPSRTDPPLLPRLPLPGSEPIPRAAAHPDPGPARPPPPPTRRRCEDRCSTRCVTRCVSPGRGARSERGPPTPRSYTRMAPGSRSGRHRARHRSGAPPWGSRATPRLLPSERAAPLERRRGPRRRCRRSRPADPPRSPWPGSGRSPPPGEPARSRRVGEFRPFPILAHVTPEATSDVGLVRCSSSGEGSPRRGERTRR